MQKRGIRGGPQMGSGFGGGQGGFAGGGGGGPMVGDTLSTPAEPPKPTYTAPT